MLYVLGVVSFLAALFFLTLAGRIARLGVVTKEDKFFFRLLILVGWIFAVSYFLAIYYIRA